MLLAARKKKPEPAPEKAEPKIGEIKTLHTNIETVALEAARKPTKVLVRDILDAIEWALDRRPSFQRLSPTIVRLIVPDVLPIPGSPGEFNPVVYQCFGDTWVMAVLTCFTKFKEERAKILGTSVMPNAN